MLADDLTILSQGYVELIITFTMENLLQNSLWVSVWRQWLHCSHPEFQLVPGHEVVGVIAKMGMNVQGFDLGNRCVADPGITVRDELHRTFHDTIFLASNSAGRAFTADEDKIFSARISKAVA